MNKNEEFLLEGERIDDLQRNGLGIIQDPGRFCFGMDAVLLSGFAKIKPGDKVCDLCTGNGIIPLLIAGKTEASEIVGLEIQEHMAGMASRSVRMNHLEDRVHIIQGDVKQATELLPKAHFQAVTCNPPYMPAGHGLKNPSSAKAIARHEVFLSFDDVAAAAAKLLVSGGRFYLVHRPQRLNEIIETLRTHDLEPKRMKFVHPHINEDANMVLIEAFRGGRPQMKLEAPIIVYKEDGTYTQEIYDVYGY